MGFRVLEMELFSQCEPWRTSLLPFHVRVCPDIFKNKTKVFYKQRLKGLLSGCPYAIQVLCLKV